MTEAGLREFFETVEPHLNERQRRVVFGSMAEVLGRGGQKMVAECSTMSTSTLSKAVREVRAGIHRNGKEVIEAAIADGQIVDVETRDAAAVKEPQG